MGQLDPGFRHSPLLGQRSHNVYSHFVKTLTLPGDVAECGVYKGATSRELIQHLERHSLAKAVHMFDTFTGLPDVFTLQENSITNSPHLFLGSFVGNIEEVRQVLRGLSKFVIHQGLFSTTFRNFSTPLCFIHADADLYSSTVDIIRLADRCLVPGGYVVFDDYANSKFPGVTTAIHEHLDPKAYEIVPSSRTIQLFAKKRCL